MASSSPTGKFEGHLLYRLRSPVKTEFCPYRFHEWHETNQVANYSTRVRKTSYDQGRKLVEGCGVMDGDWPISEVHSCPEKSAGDGDGAESHFR